MARCSTDFIAGLAGANLKRWRNWEEALCPRKHRRTDMCGRVSVWAWINQIQQYNKSSLIGARRMRQNKSLAVSELGRKMFLCALVIELGMSLISAFPVDTITFMFLIDIKRDALLCLLVLVKKKIEKIVTLLSWAASDCALITLLGPCFLEKSKPSRNADVKPQLSWMSWLNSSCAGCETYGSGQHTVNEMNSAVVRDPQTRLPNMKRKERPLCLYLAGPSWKGHEVRSDTQTCTSVLSH